jgi:hypothetical protein
MDQRAEYVDGLPNIAGLESPIDETLRSHGQAPVFWRDGTGDAFAEVGSACAIALHKHHPVIRWCDPGYRWAVEWLGCPWGHCVAPSMPVQDFRLHVRAWQHQFVGVFGLEALGREEHTVEQPRRRR